MARCAESLSLSLAPCLPPRYSLIPSGEGRSLRSNVEATTVNIKQARGETKSDFILARRLFP